MLHRHKFGFFTRADVARIFVVHISTVRRWEKSKINPLPCVRDTNGVHRFPRDVVLARAAEAGRIGSVPGSVTGQLFELFAAGMEWREAALKLKMHPTQAESLFRIFWADDQEQSARTRIALERAKTAKPRVSDAPSRPVGVAVALPEIDEWQRARNEALRALRERNDREQREWEEARAHDASGVARTPTDDPRNGDAPTLGRWPLASFIRTRTG